MDILQTILYYKLPGSSSFREYIEHAKNLQNVQLKNASPDAKLALFVNVFNMMTIHATYVQGPPRSMWDRRKVGCKRSHFPRLFAHEFNRYLWRTLYITREFLPDSRFAFRLWRICLDNPASDCGDTHWMGAASDWLLQHGKGTLGGPSTCWLVFPWKKS